MNNASVHVDEQHTVSVVIADTILKELTTSRPGLDPRSLPTSLDLGYQDPAALPHEEISSQLDHMGLAVHLKAHLPPGLPLQHLIATIHKELLSFKLTRSSASGSSLGP